MEPNPCWEANSSSATQKIISILRNPKFSYRFHESLPLVSILSQMNLGISCAALWNIFFPILCSTIFVLPLFSRLGFSHCLHSETDPSHSPRDDP
jgi:hypothetical protein